MQPHVHIPYKRIIREMSQSSHLTISFAAQLLRVYFMPAMTFPLCLLIPENPNCLPYLLQVLYCQSRPVKVVYLKILGTQDQGELQVPEMDELTFHET